MHAGCGGMHCGSKGRRSPEAHRPATLTPILMFQGGTIPEVGLHTHAYAHTTSVFHTCSHAYMYPQLQNKEVIAGPGGVLFLTSGLLINLLTNLHICDAVCSFSLLRQTYFKI